MGRKKETYKFTGIGLLEEELKWANKRFKEYRKHYPNVDSYSDIQLLEELVIRETEQERYRIRLKKLAEDISDSNDNKIKATIPKSIVNALNENLEQMLKLKDKLGLFEDKKQQSLYQYIEGLKKQFKLWKEKNWDSRKLACPFCGKVFFLNIRTDKWQANKCPFFSGRTLANKPLMELYEAKKITREEVARVLGTSPDIVEWLQKKFQENKL